MTMRLWIATRTDGRQMYVWSSGAKWRAAAKAFSMLGERPVSLVATADIAGRTLGIGGLLTDGQWVDESA